MKLLKLSLFVILFLMTPFLSQSQDKSNIQAFLIHEDRVKPSMKEQYEQISKDLVAACKEHNVQDTQWLTLALNDNSYIYITPLKNFAEIDKNAFATLNDKMGEDKVSELFGKFNPTYDEHGDYVIYLHKDLSYMPGGVSQTIEGQNYRTLYYNYVTPENEKNFEGVMKNLKKAFEKHNSKMNYRIYKTGFGVMGTYYMVAVAGVNRMESAKLGDENWTLMKDDFAALLKELRKYTWKNNEKTGWMREDLGYMPTK
jgi:hypothetical protein